MKTQEELNRLADHRGIIRTDDSQVRRDLNECVRAGLLARPSHGIYSLPEGG